MKTLPRVQCGYRTYTEQLASGALKTKVFYDCTAMNATTCALYLAFSDVDEAIFDIEELDTLGERLRDAFTKLEAAS